MEAAIDILDKSPLGECSEAIKGEQTRENRDAVSASRKHWNEFAPAELKAKEDNFPTFPIYDLLYNNFDTGKEAKGITITYRQYYRDTMEEIEMKKILKHSINLIIKTFKDNAKERFKMILLSEYDENCNFHWHGYITGLKKNEYAKLHSGLTKQIGFNKIEHNVMSWIRWTSYIMKEFNEDTLMIMTKTIYGGF